jgi:5-formaminoimidazole-4-carboxamide-1-(beta)-D-ribofuranosyl 5'-monophosphate synthetase
MINREETAKIVGRYRKKGIGIGCLGSHSALDICEGAVSEGFNSFAYCERGRESPYAKYYKTIRKRGERIRGVVDCAVVLEKFKDILEPAIQWTIINNSIIFVPNRSFWVYCGEKEIQKKFLVPIFGSRQALHLEDREKEQFN